MNASTTAELQSLLQENDYDFRFNCGYSKPTPRIDISEKEELIRVVWLHYIFFLPHAELEQLRKGLRNTAGGCTVLFTSRKCMEFTCCIISF